MFATGTPLAKLFSMIVIGFAGYFVQTHVAPRLKAGRANLRWEYSVQGQVLQSEAITEKLGPITAPHPQIRYRYIVGSKAYIADTYQSGSDLLSFDPEETQRILNQYPVGAKIQVIYDKENPEQAVIVQGVASNLWLEMIAGVIAMLWGFRQFLAINRHQ